MTSINSIAQSPRQHRLKYVENLVTTNPTYLNAYLSTYTQTHMAKVLDIPQSRLSDVLLVLKEATRPRYSNIDIDEQ